MNDKRIKVEINDDGTIIEPICPFCGGDVQYSTLDRSYMYITWLADNDDCEVGDLDKAYPTDEGFRYECKKCDRQWATAKDYYHSVRTGEEPAKMATSAKVVVVIEGGMVTDIMCNDPGIDVLEIDRDQEGSASPVAATWKSNVCGDEKEMVNLLVKLNEEFDQALNNEEDEDAYWQIEGNQSTLLTFIQHLKNGTTL